MALTETTAGEPSPMASQQVMPTFSASTRLLVVAPHPDDETIATGLLIQQVLAVGGEVRIVLLTAGDNNPWPQRWLERRWRIGAAERVRWGRRRHAELLEALQCMGVPQQALQSMGWPDMGVTDRLMRHAEQSLAAMAEAIEQFKPSLVVIPSIDDRHPDHGAAHVLVRLALDGCSEPPQQLAYLIHGNVGSAAHVELHGSAAQLEHKTASLQAHRTQMALSGRRMHRLASGAERYVALSSARCDPPLGPDVSLPWQPLVWLRPWLRIDVASKHGMRSWRWRDAPLQRDDSGAYRLVGIADGAPGPYFIKLTWDLRSFWIFDHWGWRKA